MAAKKRKVRKRATQARSAKTGQYVSKAEALRRPATTVLERVLGWVGIEKQKQKRKR